MHTIMTKFSRAFSVLLLAFSFLLSTIAQADSPQSFLQVKHLELTELIKKPKSTANDKKLTDTFDALLDYNAFAKDSLGEDWDARSAAERKEFESLLTVLIQRSYTTNIRDTLDYTITFHGEQPAKGGQLVQSVAKHKTDARKEAIHIDYLVHKNAGTWRVFDIVTEGESLVGNYRSQFRRIIKKSSFSGLLDKMRKKEAEG
jgi:phospholipid transport system substrate-binding protein